MKLRKTLLVLLAITMAIGTTTISVAEVIQGGFPDTKESVHDDAISYLKALGTLKGDGDTGNFRPNDLLSRQEFAVIITRLAQSLDGEDYGTTSRMGDPIPDIDITVNQSPGGSSPPPPPPPSSSTPTDTSLEESMSADPKLDEKGDQGDKSTGDPIPGIDITVNQSPGGSSPPPPPPPSSSVPIEVSMSADPKLDEKGDQGDKSTGDPIPGIDITVNQSPGGSSPPPPPPPSSSVPIEVFTDASVVADWALDSVGFVAEQGWVKGYQDGSFGPRRSLTHAEAITVLLRVLGYEETLDQGQWPAAYVAKAEELGIGAGVDIIPQKTITRAEMAQLTYNTLFIPGLEEIEGDIIAKDPIIRDVSGMDMAEGNGLGDSLVVHIGDLDSDGYGDVLRAYGKIITPTGEMVEAWNYVHRIEELTDGFDGSDEGDTQRVADLKKLADELVNIISFDDGDDDFPDPTDEPVQLVADLKKLADELVNSYYLSEETILIGAESTDELSGTMVRVTFDSDGRIMIMEARPDPEN